MQEFITVIGQLKRGSPFSETDAFADILTMADENGEFYATIRQLMDRWGWKYKRTFSFMKRLESGIIKESQKNHKGNTLYRINTELFECQGITKESQRNHKGITNNEEVAKKLNKILDAWNELSQCGIEPIPEIGISSAQCSYLKNLIENYGFDDAIATIQRIKISTYLQGKNKYGWKITFNWFIKEENYQKVRSGKYDGGNTVSQRIEKRSDAEQGEEEELIGDEWVYM